MLMGNELQVMELNIAICDDFLCVPVSGKCPVKDISGCPVHLPAGTVLPDGLQPVWTCCNSRIFHSSTVKYAE